MVGCKTVPEPGSRAVVNQFSELGAMAWSPVVRPLPCTTTSQTSRFSEKCRVFWTVARSKVNSYGPVEMVVPGVTSVRTSVRGSNPPATQTRPITNAIAAPMEPNHHQVRARRASG